MIESGILYVKGYKFNKGYIPSDINRFYEKYGFIPVDKLENYSGDIDTVFMKKI